MVCPHVKCLLSGCSWASWSYVTLDVSCRGRTCGGCAVTPEGCQQLIIARSPAGRGQALHWGSALCRVMGNHSPLCHTHGSNRGGWCVPVPRKGMNGKENPPVDQTAQDPLTSLDTGCASCTPQSVDARSCAEPQLSRLATDELLNRILWCISATQNG